MGPNMLLSGHTEGALLQAEYGRPYRGMALLPAPVSLLDCMQSLGLAELTTLWGTGDLGGLA